MKTSIFVSSIAVALLLTPVLASAQAQDTPASRPGPQGRPGAGQMRPGANAQGRMGMGMGMMQQRQSLKDALGLSDVQKADLRKVKETAQRDRLRKSTDFRIASMDLKSLLRAEKVDEKAVAAKLAEVQAAQGALLKVRVDAALALKRVLTPEQQKKIAELRALRGGAMGHARMNQRMNRGGGMGRGQGMGRGRGRAGMGRPAGGPGDDDESDLDFDFEGDNSEIR